MSTDRNHIIHKGPLNWVNHFANLIGLACKKDLLDMYDGGLLAYWFLNVDGLYVPCDQKDMLINSCRHLLGV